jgi:hypothetical protein
MHNSKRSCHVAIIIFHQQQKNKTMPAKKIQSKCIQTFLSPEGELLCYRTCLPISKDFYYSKQEEYIKNRKDYFVTVKNKIFYQFSSVSFSDVKRELILVQIDIINFKKEALENRKTSLEHNLTF